MEIETPNIRHYAIDPTEISSTQVKEVEVYALATLGLQAIAALSALGIFLVQVHAIRKMPRPVLMNKGRRRKGRK
jgi:hypothetical protein